MADIDDLFRDPNGSAYEAREVRTGPPLGYVGEKLANSLRAIHAGHALAPGNHDVTAQFRRAFHYAFVAFLALHNILALADLDREPQLLALSTDDFSDWLANIEREGSVTG